MTSRMITPVPSWHPRGGTDFSHNLFLGGHCARLIENSCHWSLDLTGYTNDELVPPH
jgi:hypothetical protein